MIPFGTKETARQGFAFDDKMGHAAGSKLGASYGHLKSEFGYGLDSLTQGEAGHFRKAVSLDSIRNRIAAAKQEGVSGHNDEGLSSVLLVPKTIAIELPDGRYGQAF